MIEYIAGTLSSKKPTEAIIDIQGLGYKLLIPMSTFESLPEIGKDARLLCHQHVREDALLLFGFGTASERSLFNLFIGVSGIGPKLALAALSSLPASELKHRIRSGQADLLTRIPGVGKKTAQRIVIELRDRLDDGDDDSGLQLPVDERTQARADALAALEALGMSRNAADKNLTLILNKQPEITSAEDLIRLALRS
jgi:Holliday junction DNA helicase RuvA